MPQVCLNYSFQLQNFEFLKCSRGYLILHPRAEIEENPENSEEEAEVETDEGENDDMEEDVYMSFEIDPSTVLQHDEVEDLTEEAGAEEIVHDLTEEDVDDPADMSLVTGITLDDCDVTEIDISTDLTFRETSVGEDGDRLSGGMDQHDVDVSNDSDIPVLKKSRPQVVVSDDEDNEEERLFTKDKNSRLHYKTSRSGPAFIVNASTQASPSTIEAHVNDLVSIFERHPEELKSILTVCSDDGEDYSLRAEPTPIYMARLMKKLNQRRVNLIRYAPGDSRYLFVIFSSLEMFKYFCCRYNPQERVWAATTHRLANTVLDPECKIMKSQDRSKTPAENMDKDVLRDSMNIVKDKLSTMTFGADKHPVTTVNLDPDEDTLDFDGERIPNNAFSDLEEVRNFFRKTPSQMKAKHLFTDKEKEIHEELLYVYKHASTGKHSFSIARCDDKSCTDCQEFYAANPAPPGFEKLTLPTLAKNNNLWYEPERDPDQEDSYKTYIDQKNDLKRNPDKVMKPDTNIPDGKLDRCQEEDCNFGIRSDAAGRRHYLLGHNKSAPTNQTKTYQCKFEGCNLSYPSPYYLAKHKTEANHKQENETRGRRRKVAQAQPLIE